MRPTGPEEVREAILDAAASLMRDRGPTSVSVREIARAANVNHGLLHHYFGGKQPVILALLDRRARTLAATIPRAASTTDLLRHLYGDEDAGLYTRLVAYLMVEQHAVQPGQLRGWIATELSDAADGDDATGRTAAVMALLMGWELFRPLITAVVPLPPAEAGSDAVLELAASLLQG